MLTIAVDACNDIVVWRSIVFIVAKGSRHPVTERYVIINLKRVRVSVGVCVDHYVLVGDGCHFTCIILYYARRIARLQ